MVDNEDADPVYDDQKERIEAAIKQNDLATVREIVEAGFKYRREQKKNFRLPFEDHERGHKPDDGCYYHVIQAGLYPAFLDSISDSIALGNIEMVTLVLKAEPDLDCMNNYGDGPLHLAASIKDRDTRWRMVKLLMEAGATVEDDGLPKFATTCVHQAVVANDFELVKHFLDAGAKLNCLDVSDHSLFHSAYLSIEDDEAFFNMIKLLVEAGADVNIAGKKGSTFLHFVSANELCKWELVELLLDLGAHLNIVNSDNVSPLALAAHSGNLDLVKNMIQAGADVNISKKCTGSPLQYEADIKVEDGDGINILTYAAEISDSLQERAMMQLFYDGQHNFYSKKIADYKDILEMIFAHGVNMNNTQFGENMPFQSVLRRGNIEAMNLFMEIGVRLETCGIRFPLHLAASNPHYEVLEYLLDRHLYDVDEINDDGVTPLYVAAQYRHCASTIALIKNGSDVNFVCKKVVGKNPTRTIESTALREAILNSSLEECFKLHSYLLDDVLDSLGHFRLVEFLFAAGASMKNKDVYRACKILADGAETAVTARKNSVYLTELIKCIAKQIVLLQSQSDAIDSKFEDYFLKNTPNISGLIEQCSSELAQLKTIILYGSTTLYDVLTGKDITFFISKQRVVDKFRSLDLDRNFRNYGCQLVNCFSLAQHKRKLTTNAKAVLNEVLGFYFDNFEIILYCIMRHLPLKDIIILCHMSER